MDTCLLLGLELSRPVSSLLGTSAGLGFRGVAASFCYKPVVGDEEVRWIYTAAHPSLFLSVLQLQPGIIVRSPNLVT